MVNGLDGDEVCVHVGNDGWLGWRFACGSLLPVVWSLSVQAHTVMAAGREGTGP